MKFKKGDLVCYKSNPDICIGSIANESIGLHSKPCYNIHLDDEYSGKFFYGNHPDTYVVAEDMIMLYGLPTAEEFVEQGEASLRFLDDFPMPDGYSSKKDTKEKTNKLKEKVFNYIVNSPYIKIKGISKEELKIELFDIMEDEI